MDTKRNFTATGRDSDNQMWINIAVSATLTPVIGYFIGFTSPLVILGLAAGGVFLAVIVYKFRGLIGGFDMMETDTDGITVQKGKKKDTIRWDDMSQVEFNTVNGTPWILFNQISSGKRKMICLEKLEPEDLGEFTSIVSDKVPGKVEITEDWIIANKIPVRTEKRTLDK